jgi:hypothetical protein
MLSRKTQRALRAGAMGVAAAVLAISCQKAEAPKPPQARASFTFPRSVPVARKDAFLGLHFDLHPQETDTSLGAEISEDNIRDLLTRVKPDYVQYNCKGHAGWTGYPTEVGWASPGIVKDSLAAWRKATRDFGVGLFIHYSGVWDSKAVKEHPEWARVGPDGKRDPNATSVFGRYVDKLLIPHLDNIRLTIKTEAKPKSVTWVPDGGALEWSWSDGRLSVIIPKLKIHGIVVIE